MPEDLDEYHGEQFLVRPNPIDELRSSSDRFHRTGKRHRGMISDSWWEKGGLLHDDRGPALLDAEGERIPLGPFPPGSLLIRVHAPGSGTLNFDEVKVVGPPPAYQNLARLPRGTGLPEALGIHGWADASGLEYKHFGGYEKPPGQGQFLQDQDLGRWVMQDREQREWKARQPRGLRRLVPPPLRRLLKSSDAAPH